MKILHLTGNRSDHGGILALLRALQGAPVEGVHHTVWVHAGFEETRKPALDLRRGEHALDETRSPWEFLSSSLRSWAPLKRLLSAESFDVIHAHTRGSFLLACRLHRRRGQGNPPVLFTNHAYARRTWLYRTAAQRWGLPTVALTRHMADYYGLSQESGPGWVEIISACCSDAFFQPPLSAGLRQQFTPTTPLRLAGLGNLVRWKGWDLAFKALAQLSADDRARVRFDLWGPTVDDADSRSYANELAALIGQHQLQGIARLAGTTRDSQGVLQSADWLLHPAEYEPCSLALMEALASGKPALASASGGSAEIVTHGRNGFHFAPANPSDLAEQLRRILAGSLPSGDPATIRESVRPRSATRIAATYRDLYQRLIGQNSHARD